MEILGEKVRLERSLRYPEPLIFNPISELHKQTFIILHGRGSTAHRFGRPLLGEEIGENGSLQKAFPDAKFVFPGASTRRATVFKRTPISQWFDCWSPVYPEIREELQFDGLCDSSRHVHGILEHEIALVGAKKVVLGGMSQGCATTLMSLLLWNGEPLGAAFGICGWLPLRNHLLEVAAGRQQEWEAEIQDDDGSLQDNPFEDYEDDEANPKGGRYLEDHPKRAVLLLCEQIHDGVGPLEAPSMSFAKTPLFLGNGEQDEKVPAFLGSAAAECMRVLGSEHVTFREYPGLGHWYRADLLQDLVTFLHDIHIFDGC